MDTHSVTYKVLSFAGMVTLFLGLAFPQTAQAQVQTGIQMLAPTQPVQPAIGNAVQFVLTAHEAELDTDLYYLISNVVELPERNSEFIVSVLGVNAVDWSLENNLIWAGSVFLYPGMDGSLWGDICNPPDMTCELVKADGYEVINLESYVRGDTSGAEPQSMAAMSPDMVTEQASTFTSDPLAPLLWPSTPGQAPTFGILGFHASGFTSYPMIGDYFHAIDLVGGDDMAWNENMVYATHDMRVVSICADMTSQAVIFYIDLPTNQGVKYLSPYMIYAHLALGQFYIPGWTFTRGGTVGKLRAGTFSDTCGNATQAANHWHLHWAMPQAYLKIDNCAVDPNEDTLTCMIEGTATVINPGDEITGSGEAPSAQPDGSNFWDWIVGGINNIYQWFLAWIFPDARSYGIADQLTSSASLGIKVAYTLAGAFINLQWPLIVFILVMLGQIIMVPFAILRTIYKIIPGAG